MNRYELVIAGLRDRTIVVPVDDFYALAWMATVRNGTGRRYRMVDGVLYWLRRINR